MNQSAEPNTVHLSPTPGQYVQAFIWVAAGLVISVFFLWLSLRGDQMGTGGLVIGAVVLAISVASGILEYRNLPGVTLRFESDRLTVRPHVGRTEEVSLSELDRMETEHVAPVTRRSRRRDAMIPGQTPRPRFGNVQAGWHLKLLRTDGEPVGPLAGYRVGLDEDRTQALREACRRAGVHLLLGN